MILLGPSFEGSKRMDGEFDENAKAYGIYIISEPTLLLEKNF